VAFTDWLAAYRAYLGGVLAPAIVIDTRRPDPLPPRLVQLRMLPGAPVQPVRELVRIDVICWDATEHASMALARDVRARTWALAGAATLGAMVYTVNEFASPFLVDDPIGKRPRAMATYDLTCRANDIIHGQYDGP
jgi:hypothetical protein